MRLGDRQLAIRPATTAAVIVALVLSVAGCSSTVTGTASGAPAGGSTATRTPGTTTTDTTGNSDAYTVQEQAFSVDFPAKPERSTQPLAQVPGATVVLYGYQSADRVSLTAGYIDYPASVSIGPAATALNNARDGELKNVPGGKLVSSTPTTVSGRPALDVVATVQGGNLRSRLLLDGRRLYQLITLGTDSIDREHETFVSSFKLK